MSRFAVCTLLLGAFGLAGYAPAPAAQEPRAKTSAPPMATAPPAERRANELQLARLRPGISRLADAEKLYPAQFRLRDSASASQPIWVDGCTGRQLRLELSEAGSITSVTVTSIGAAVADCESYVSPQRDALKSSRWSTGRGLRLGDPSRRVLALYGPPASRAPSTQAGLDLELLYYEFDWAGPDVPQVMEISCDRKTGRVVQMTLSFPSL